MLVDPILIKPGIGKLLINLAEKSVKPYLYCCRHNKILFLLNDHNHVSDNNLYHDAFAYGNMYSISNAALIALYYKADDYNVYVTREHKYVAVNLADPEFSAKILQHFDNFDPTKDGMR